MTSSPEVSQNQLDPATFKRILTRAVVLPLVLLALLSGLFYWQIKRLLDTASLAEHSDQVLSKANRAQALLIDMETGLRGYVIARQPQFLEPYNNASKQITPSLNDLQQTVADNPTQQQRVNDIRAQYQEWDKYAQTLIHPATTPTEAQARIATGQGKRMMDSMRVVFTSFIDTEESLRTERTQSVQRATRLAVGSGLVAALLLGLILSSFIRRQLMFVSDSYGNALAAEKKQRQWLGTTLSSIGDAVIATDAQGHINFMNGVAESVTGWRDSEATGQPLPKVFNIINEETRVEVESPVAKVLREEQVVGLANHTILIRKDGSEIPIDDSGAPIRNDAGKITGVVLVFRDITARKQAENELIESELRLRRAVVDSPIPTIIHDENDRILELSKGWTKQSGYTLEDLPTITAWTQRAFGEKQALSSTEIDQLFQKNETMVNGLRTVRAKDGTERLWEFFSTPLGKTGSGSRLMLSVAVDVTDQKKAEHRLEHLLEREQTLRAEADQANRLKDEFFTNASHELRTPLTAIVGWVRMLRRGQLDEPTQASALETIERNAKAQTKLIEDLLDTSRVITGKLTLDLHSTEIAPIVTSAVNTLRPTADSKNIQIETNIDNETWLVMADTNRLQQVVWNLLSNAIKFTPNNGTITVSLQHNQSEAELSISDSGEGIEPDFLPFVFERFRQADGSKTRRHGGLGLGLAIVRSIVELHGGTVAAESEGQGLGATFRVKLPLISLDQSGSTGLFRKQSDLSTQQWLDCPPHLEGARVLVVDDDRDTRGVLAALLTQCDARVLTAASAAEALSEINKQKPDVLVSDVGMPEEDGYALIGKIRKQESERGEKNMPALALTAYAKAEDRVRALSAGYNAHLSKPVEPAEFALMIANLLGRT
jgi:PAS domain S-box-containing protein